MGSPLGNLICVLFAVTPGILVYLFIRELEQPGKEKAKRSPLPQNNSDLDWWDQPGDPDDPDGWTNGDYIMADELTDWLDGKDN